MRSYIDWAKDVVKDTHTINVGWGFSVRGICPHCGVEVTKAYQYNACWACGGHLVWPSYM